MDDYGWGSTAPGGAAGPPPDAGGAPPPSAVPMATLPDPSTMSVKELKAELMNLGVDFTDCYEKSELQAKLAAVQEKQRNVLQIDARTTAPATAVVIFLHGLGDQAAGWMGPLQSISQRLPWVRFLVPNAPILKVTLNGGAPMPAWFDVKELRPEAPEDEETIQISNQFLVELIKDEIARGISPRRIVIGGFSQGGAVALNTAIKYPERLGGAFALSAWLPLAANAASAATPASRDVPFALYHGTADTVVPFAWGKSSADELTKTHAATLFKEYDGMGHQSNSTETSDVADWLISVIPNAK